MRYFLSDITVYLMLLTQLINVALNTIAVWELVEINRKVGSGAV